jgi:hypothetical protein
LPVFGGRQAREKGIYIKWFRELKKEKTGGV